MINNKIKPRKSNQENFTPLERFHTLRNFGKFSSKNLFPNKLSKNLNFYLCNVSSFSNNTKIDKNSQNENQIQSRRKNKTLDNIRDIKIKNKNKNKNKIVCDVEQIYEKIYSRKKNNNPNIYTNIINKNSANNILSKILPQKEKTNFKKTIMHDSHSQTQIGSFNIRNKTEKRITCNFGDFPYNQISYNHPQLYILNNKNNRINRKLHSKSILSNIIVKNPLFIKRRSNLSELIPDYVSSHDYNNRETLYKYYLRKKMEYKKFN